MEPLYDVSAEAQNDLFEIWRRIAADSVELADRIDGEFHELFGSLGRIRPASARWCSTGPEPGGENLDARARSSKPTSVVSGFAKVRLNPTPSG